MESFLDPRNFLSMPQFYSFFENMVGARSFRRLFCESVIKDASHARILDLGCGTAQILEFLSFKEYVGVDESLKYVEFARKKQSKKVRFEPMNVLTASLHDLGDFDLVLALGLFHHLPDPAFEAVLKKIRGILRHGGRVVSFDPCLHDGQSFLSKQFVSMDRGKYVRSFDLSREIALSVFPDTEALLWKNKLRIPYSHCIMEMK